MKQNNDSLPFISVIISTYNRARYIELTINSFLNQSYPENSYEIIICDNNSTDSTREIIAGCKKKEGWEKVHYLFEKRQGMHFARNYAAQQSKGEILYFADDDTLADIHLLTEIVKVFQNDKVGCASGRILPKWECTPPAWIQKYCCNALLSLNDRGRTTRIYKNDPGVFGCHEAIRRDVFFEVGGFHPDLIGRMQGVGDGETGMNDDIRKAGYYLAYVGTSVTYHMIPQKRMTWKYLNKRFAYNGNTHSYTDYRRMPFTKKEIPVRMLKYIKDFILAETKVLRQWCKGEMSLRFLTAHFYYYIARMKYDIQIVRNKDIRAFVENNNWF